MKCDGFLCTQLIAIFGHLQWVKQKRLTNSVYVIYFFGRVHVSGYN